MNIRSLTKTLNVDQTGCEMHRLIEKLYPICRSITGNGVRQSLNIIREFIPVEVHEVPSGTHVFDWTVPREWNIADAYIRNSKGEKIVDFKQCNLHVVGYSTPVARKMSLQELKQHLFTLPDHPEWIPFRTSFYHDSWGFCLSQNSG